MATKWIKGEIMAVQVDTPGKMLIRDDSGMEYVADRFCDRKRDEDGELWFKVEE